ncbi:GFA family protein [Tistlia consotensis]|nr:GFA family protein [Tistlia consotensis]
MTEKRGRCLCGAVTFRYEGPENWRAFCHCESCRRQTSSPVTAFVGVPRTAAEVVGETLAAYESSPGVRRSFCSRCGSPIAYESDRWPDEIHFYTAALEDPEQAPPEYHVHFAEHLSWLKIDDGLERHPRSGQ